LELERRSFWLCNSLSRFWHCGNFGLRQIKRRKMIGAPWNIGFCETSYGSRNALMKKYNYPGSEIWLQENYSSRRISMDGCWWWTLILWPGDLQIINWCWIQWINKTYWYSRTYPNYIKRRSCKRGMEFNALECGN
jgi:hypothetical protein